MKNRLTIFLSLFLILFVVIGCSFGGLGGGSDKTSKDSSSKTKSAESTEKTEAEPSGEVVKVGIEECDELATYINDNSEAIEGSIIARGIVYVYKNMMLGKLKEGIEKMKDEEKAKFGDACTKSLEQLRKSVKK